MKHYRHKYLPIKITNPPLAAEVIVTALFILLLFSFFFFLSPTDKQPVSYKPYTVKPGDTVWDIASRNYPNQHTGEKAHQIVKENGIQDTLIKPGQEIRIPEK